MKRNTLNTFISATLIMLLGVSSSAKAMVPANSRITSTSTLTVEGLAEPLKATVTVTVGLQRSKPLIELKAGTEEEPNPSLKKWIAGKRGGENTTTELTYKYTITTTANGPADYTVEASLTEENLDKARSRVEKKAEVSIRLGATAVLSAEGNSITVPSDGKFENDNHPTTVNGITAGDKVVINGIPGVFNVDGVDDSNGKTATITLKETPLGDLSPGDPIAEQATFTVTLDEVVLAANAPQGRATNDLTVTARQENFEDATSEPQEFLVIKPRAPKMKFYVRNIGEAGNPVDAPDANKTEYKDNFYFETDLADGEVVVNADPGDTLEYLVVVRAGNDGKLAGDEYQIPETNLSYALEYVPGQTYLNRDEQPLLGEEEGDWPGVFLKHEAAAVDSKAIDSDQTAYITYQMKVIGGVGDDGEVLDSNNDMAAVNCQSGGAFVGEEWKNCQNKAWNPDKGINPNTNPVCWKSGVAWNTAESPWVVGRAVKDDDAGYDCRTKCAQGREFKWCAQDNWWKEPAAKTTTCAFKTAGTFNLSDARRGSDFDFLAYNNYLANSNSSYDYYSYHCMP